MTKDNMLLLVWGDLESVLLRRLHEAGQEVLGIDVNEERVEDAELFVTHAVSGRYNRRKGTYLYWNSQL